MTFSDYPLTTVGLQRLLNGSCRAFRFGRLNHAVAQMYGSVGDAGERLVVRNDDESLAKAVA